MSHLQILCATFMVVLLSVTPSSSQGSPSGSPRPVVPIYRCSSYYYSYYDSSIYYCGDGYCISTAYICDGYYDCLNGSDEYSCFICRGNSFRCTGDKQCRPKASYCDGIHDCADGSDEPETCPLLTFHELLDNTNKLLNDLNPANGYGAIFGGIFGIIVVFFSILVSIAVAIAICIWNKSCPIYKWRHRQRIPPVGVIVADVQDNDTDESLLLNAMEEEDTRIIIA